MITSNLLLNVILSENEDEEDDESEEEKEKHTRKMKPLPLENLEQSDKFAVEENVSQVLPIVLIEMIEDR